MRALVPQKSDSFMAESDRKTAPQGLIELFAAREEEARNVESKTDNILDGVKTEDDDEEGEKGKEGVADGEDGAGGSSGGEKTQEERIDETVAKLLDKAGSHMQHTLIASYVTLIIGYLIFEDKVTCSLHKFTVAYLNTTPLF